ncbi:hypothetical protein ACQ4PT_020397 [Festuca glaucescens]
MARKLWIWGSFCKDREDDEARDGMEEERSREGRKVSRGDPPASEGKRSMCLCVTPGPIRLVFDSNHPCGETCDARCRPGQKGSGAFTGALGRPHRRPRPISPAPSAAIAGALALERDLPAAMDGDSAWVPKGMDCSSATRIGVRVCAYAQFCDNGTQVWHPGRDELKVVDRDCINFKDFSEQLDQELKHGPNQKLLITYWDKVSHSFAEINHDTLLLTAIDMYWDERKLPIMVFVVCKGDISTSTCVPHLTSPSIPVDKPQQQHPDIEHDSARSDHESYSNEEPPVFDDWVDAEVEYVGVDDECEHKELLTDSDESNFDDGYDSDESFHDDLVVDDTLGCETIVHVTDFENPKIEVGITFEDGKCFKKAIRQYAVKGEYEIAAPYSEATSRKRQLDLDSAAIHGMCTPTKQLDCNIDTNNSPMIRSRKNSRKGSKIAAKPKVMKKTTPKLKVRRAKK